jgi:hypothetical protein
LAEDDVTEAADDGPVLPPELPVIISQFLSPGTKTMASFAMMSSEIYPLLVSRLFEAVNLSRFILGRYNKFDFDERVSRACKSLNSDALGLNRLQYVKWLDLGEWFDLKCGRKLFAECLSLREAVLSYGGKGYMGDFKHETLQVLTIRGTKPDWIPDVDLPNEDTDLEGKIGTIDF